jgi:hypothetical protein
MNASFSQVTIGRRWLLVLLLAVGLVIPTLVSYRTADTMSTVIAKQMKLSGPQEGFGG